MNSISEYIIALFELAEAEGKALKTQIVKLMATFVFMLLFICFVLISFGLFIYALYTYFSTFMPLHISLFLLSGLTLLASIGVLGYIKWKL